MQANEIQVKLAELGLTTEESSLYILLLIKGSLPAKAIALELGIIVNSVYRSTNALTGKGLITEIDVSPKCFQAVTPQVGIMQLANNKAAKLSDLSEAIIKALPVKENPNRLNMELLTGRTALFDKFVELAKDTCEEILVISIGEEVPESIWESTKDAIARGVDTKFIFHKNNQENVLLIMRWLGMKVDVRHLAGEGYHLNVFDHTSAILSASNPDHSKERTGVVIYNEAIIEVLRAYFFQQWQISRKLSLPK